MDASDWEPKSAFFTLMQAFFAAGFLGVLGDFQSWPSVGPRISERPGLTAQPLSSLVNPAMG